MALNSLQPQSLWTHFSNICSIPHPSKHESQLRDYIIKFAKSQNLHCISDKVGNIVIQKPGIKGRETQPTLVLQAHIDMVPQKNSDKVHDFTKDPIVPQIVEDWVKATGTTLGADNGIGVAAALAILQDKNLIHGPLECFFTIDEEDGMTGAAQLDPQIVSGKTLINLDSEQEGDIYVGCAGGLDGVFTFKYQLKTHNAKVSGFKLSLKGLHGGHSGLDINLERGNANKVLSRILLETQNKVPIQIHSFQGGNMRNAIPREAFAEISFSPENTVKIAQAIKESFAHIKSEIGNKDPQIQLNIEEIQINSPFIVESSQILKTITACPHGVISMSPDIKDLVETSTNMAIVKTQNSSNSEGEIKIQCFMRSSVDSALDSLAQTHKALFDLAQFKSEFGGKYSGWKPNMNSKILKITSSTYESMYKKSPSVKAIHAGLETGYFTKHFPTMDMVSIGPTIRHPHSPDEKVSISSVKNFWEYLTKILANFDS